VTNRENCSSHTRVTSSKYVGVWFHKSSGKWQSSIKVAGRAYYLGQFETEKEASKTYQTKLHEILKAAGLQEEE